MKKINSNSYGGKVIGIGIVLAAIIPCCLRLVNLIFCSRVFNILSLCFMFLGILVLLGFFVFLSVELKQDKKIDHYYSEHHNIKIPWNDIYYECSNCGNRKVRKEDTSCLVCGVHFSEESDRSVEEILAHNEDMKTANSPRQK